MEFTQEDLKIQCEAYKDWAKFNIIHAINSKEIKEWLRRYTICEVATWAIPYLDIKGESVEELANLARKHSEEKLYEILNGPLDYDSYPSQEERMIYGHEITILENAIDAMYWIGDPVYYDLRKELERCDYIDDVDEIIEELKNTKEEE